MAKKRQPKKGDPLPPPLQFTAMIDNAIGRLTLAIGKGNFRDEVTLILDETLRIGFQRGKKAAK